MEFDRSPEEGSDLALAGEHLALCADRELGARAVIAVDDTTLGPAVGGVRYAPYPSTRAAVKECIRLAETMTLKNATAGLPYGGAKSIIVRDDPAVDREALMRFFARGVERLGGIYIPGVDIGTTVEDLAIVAEIAPDVACDAEDPSPWTAVGVLAGIRAALEHEGSELTGCRVAVQGAGHVGSELVRLLVAEGADVRVCDVDPSRASAVADRFGARVIEPGSVFAQECDVFAPCAMAKVVTPENVGLLGCRIVAGAANDTLADDETATLLADRGIVYVPDFVLNAGGVIHIHALRMGWAEQELRRAVLDIGGRVGAVLEESSASGHPPLSAAKELAYTALGREPATPAFT